MHLTFIHIKSLSITLCTMTGVSSFSCVHHTHETNSGTIHLRYVAINNTRYYKLIAPGHIV